MGSPVSAVVANLYMEGFEQNAFAQVSFHMPPSVWKRYVDDTFIIVNRSETDSLLSYMNSQQPSIQFTLETEQGGKLAFLDTLVQRHEGGKLSTSVYRKPLIQTNTYHMILITTNRSRRVSLNACSTEQHFNNFLVYTDLSKNYNFKVSLEHQLPIASQKLKTTDECVVSSLISLVTCTGKISNFMKTNLDFFKSPVGYGNSKGSSTGGHSTSPCVPLLRQRAVAYMAALNKPCPETVPYYTAVQNQRILLSSTESKEGLAQQVASSSSRIARLEQEKEHWVLEAQLLQIKYDREIQVCDQMVLLPRQV
nr:protein phosphatase 1 regulatory subunit 21-like [Lytechinus pictus]